jgi:monooxygenase
MEHKGFMVCTPDPEPRVERRPLIDFTSGYVQRMLATAPSQGDRSPWRVQQNYVKDLAAMTLGRIDRDLVFSRNGTFVRA